jgi:N,N'-diacetyllegionaminate synthase
LTRDRSFLIGDRSIGGSAPCFIVAEVGLAHDGSLGNAHAFIDAAAGTGADAIKFQTHVATAEGTREESFRVNVFPQDATRADYWQRTAFTPEQWESLKQHAENRRLQFLSTPFSQEAVVLLRQLQVKAWKVGSGEANNPFLLEAVAAGHEPVLLSTGMSYISEVDAAVQFFVDRNVPLALLQCTNRYPCPPEYLGLNVLSEYRARYDVPVGFSDHSGEIAPGLAAVTLGANVLEVHVTWHKNAFGPDVDASLTFDSLRELVKGVRMIEQALAAPVNKDLVARDLDPMRRLFTKGIVARIDLPQGTILLREHLDAKKPCIGVPASAYDTILGKKTLREIRKDEHITLGDLQ